MKLRTLIVSSLVVLSLAACNAGSTLPSGTSGTVSTTATAVPTIAPFSSNTSTVSTAGLTSGGTVSGPSAGGFTPSITLPGFAGPASVSVTTAGSAPVGVATFSSYGPVAQGNRAAQSKPSNATTLLYVGFTPSATSTISAGSVVVTLGLPAATSGEAYYLAFFDGTVWHTELDTTPGTISTSGTSVNFAFTLANSLTMTTGTNYAVALYAVPSSATPAPSTLTATSTPGVIATALPSTGTISTGASQTLNLTESTGSTASVTLPALDGSSYTYSKIQTVPSGVTGTTGTFLTGATVTSPSTAATIAANSKFSYSVTPSSTIAGKTLSLYVIPLSSTGAPSGSATLVGTAVAGAAGTAVTGTGTVSAAYTVPASTSYTVAVYYQ